MVHALPVDFDKDEALAKLLMHALGGDDATAMLLAYHDPSGPSMSTLAIRFGLDKSNVCRTIHRAHTTLRGLGMMPEEWEASV